MSLVALDISLISLTEAHCHQILIFIGTTEALAIAILVCGVNNTIPMTPSPKEKKIFMTEQWICPKCGFPENFTPTCSLCQFENGKAEPESERSRKKYD